MLKNLNEVIYKCRETFDIFPRRIDIHINEELESLLQKALTKAEPDSTFLFREYSIELANSDGLKADIPSTWLWYGYAFHEFKDALNDYQNFIKDLKEHYRNLGINAKQMDVFLKNFPKEDALDGSNKLLDILKKYVERNYSSNDQELITTFLTQRSWWFVPQKQTKQTTGKTLDRTDIFKSSFYLACRVIVANSDRLTTVAEAFVNSRELVSYFDNLDLQAIENKKDQLDSLLERLPINDQERIQTGYNKIYYGAPGTGKSHTINKKVNHKYTIRTVFHPDTQNSDFIGSLKPVMVDGKINYEFRPGSFTDAIILAVKNPDKECTLIIEEINRAAAAAAFGEIFQLLDRLPSRQSKYPINISDQDWLNYLNSKTNGYFDSGELVIPSNLTLLATMNSSDQAVMPLDTAFKRRWEFEYLPIDYSMASDGTLPLPLSNGDGQVAIHNVYWADFAKAVNSALAADHIPEDKLLGHRFLDTSELNENGESSLNGKLFMYLWDDVLRHGQRGAIFAEYIEDEEGIEVELTTYGQLIQAYNRSKSILRESLEDELIRLTARRANQS